MSNGPEITPLASPPTSEPWVPLWPLQPSALGELGYGQITTMVTASATSEATATPIVTASPVTVDGQTPIVIEWFLPSPVFSDQPTAHMFLFDGSTSMCSVWRIDSAEIRVNTFLGIGVRGAIRLTPTAGTHTYSIRGFVSSGAGIVVYAGTGAGGQWSPCFVRVSLAAPIMPHVAGAALPVSYGTSLPGGPLDGQEAILVDSLTNPSYQWRFRYNAGSSSAYKWEFVGGAPRTTQPSGVTGGVGTTLMDVSGGSTFTLPRAGDYNVEAGLYGSNNGTYIQYLILGQLALAGTLIGPQMKYGCPAAYLGSDLSGPYQVRNASAGAVLTVRGGSDRAGALTDIAGSWLEVIPVRVS